MLLAIDTAETACSAALIAGGEIIDERHEVVGRGHAERLVPMIAELLADRRPAGIAVDCGPGSFTGIRVGIAAARGLALGWNVPVSGFASTVLIAASAFNQFDVDRLAVVMTGGHGQLFVECFQRAPFESIVPLGSLFPEDAARVCGAMQLAVGSGVGQVVAHGFAAASGKELIPRAADARLLGDAQRSLAPSPIYGRPPDAKPKSR